MARQSLPVALTAVLLPAVLLTSAKQPTSLPGTLELHNRRWERVRVEVRVGPSENCDRNEAHGPTVLRRDESWAVVSDEIVCWRRDRLPGDASGGWTAWEHTRLASNEVRDVTL